MRRSIQVLRSFAFGACLALSGALPAHAGLTNDVPSCYAANKIAPPQAPYDQFIYVLIDQTVLLDATLQKSVLDNVQSMLKPGTKFVIAEFSAFSQGHYLNVLHTGVIERPIPPAEESNVVMRRLRDFHTCMQQQLVYGQRLAVATTAQVLKSGTSNLDQSDILMALKSVSPAVAQEKVARKLVFVVTDGLENSSVTSFYARNAVRHINPDVELKKVQDNNLFGDFGSTRIYVLGGGVMPPAANGSTSERNGYRDPKTLLDLKRFWSGYFSRSNARLVEFGEPALLEPLSW
ncbi:hypothetical protein WL93_03425 [Burkholderia diffusa]|uniref:hypothetical protein n=1 Tax=Burkholderia diffusa TaxID=488732 RepID=UPI00075C4570|nr:hypothetical protein [Burkholderia diffusa]KWF97551.1 hypothetical protein WL93_03425 [Burkholderia diffusa]